jgi:branched-chain amino acid transport system permease protein
VTLAERSSFTTRPDRSGRRWRRIFLVAGAALFAYALLAPLTSTDAAQAIGVPLLADRLWFRIATIIAMFAVMASAWNIIGGLTGYAAFGNVAFFGIGAYSTGMLIAKAKWPFLVALPAAPLASAAFATLIGLPLLRLRGHYFAVASLGVGVAVGEVIQNVDFRGQPVFGGSTGLFLPIVGRDITYFYLMVGAAMVAIAVTWWVLRSRFGYGLIAIRENEEAAAVMGVNTTAHKVAAFALAAALTGLAGGIYAQWNVFINQENVFPIEYNVQMILMALIGGAGTLFGPAVGAVLLELLIQFLSGSLPISADIPFVPTDARPVVAQVILGLLLVVVVVFVPRGIIDFFGGHSRLSLAHLRRSLRETSV